MGEPELYGGDALAVSITPDVDAPLVHPSLLGQREVDRVQLKLVVDGGDGELGLGGIPASLTEPDEQVTGGDGLLRAHRPYGGGGHLEGFGQPRVPLVGRTRHSPVP